MSRLTQRADSCIRNHTGFAMAAAVVPVPVADIGAITAVEIDMLRALTKIYGLKWTDQLGKQALGIAAAATGGTAIWASIAKLVPGLGTAVGGAIQMTVAGSVCYALGKAYQTHLETGGEVIDPDTFKQQMKDHMAEGREFADVLDDDVRQGKYDKGGGGDDAGCIA